MIKRLRVTLTAIKLLLQSKGGFKNMNFQTLETCINGTFEKCRGRVSLMLEMDGHVYEFNSDEVYSSASLIKIPILIEGFRQVEKGILRLDQQIRVEEYSKAGGAGVIHVLSPGMVLTINDLMTLMIIVSDNTATNILIDLIGKDSINDCIHSLGLSCTKLARHMMDLDAIRQGKNNLTSAADMVVLLKIINEGSFLSEESRQEILYMMSHQQFNHKLPAFMDLDKVFVANKTGELPAIEHDCAIIGYQGKTVYVAVLIDEIAEKESARYVLNRIGKLIYEYIIK
jgi:beta-lactamase class A